ncbi:MAG: hypothetical protein NC320_02855 [Clostridium sp.]|nr:hypothetical protein [Clostridium sp.]MCM1547005.1 hypothetical protein [Ruminococcus sp.]
MKKIITVLLVSGLLIGTFSGCSTDDSASESSTSQSAETSGSTENNIAGEGEKAPEIDLGAENLTPVYGNELKDGVYKITAESSSSMFKIVKCELTVDNGEMTAVMTMSGKGYLYIFMGKGEDAVESGYIHFEENENGEHTYTVPVEALDKAIDCSAFSKKKEKWYDRTLVFRSASLPSEAFSDGGVVGLKDGEYTVNVTLSGGSGRASVESPAKLSVEDGVVYAEIVWSSSNYDYMIVDGVKYEVINTEGNSTFKIPVTYFDHEMPVSANTTAMSAPHEIEYTLNFDSASIF